MKTMEFFFKEFNVIELYLPIIVLVFSMLSPFIGTGLSSNLFSVTLNKDLAVPQSLPDIRHISHKFVSIVLFHFTSKNLIVLEFIFSIPVSLDPSVPNING